jgi:peptidoglycan/LPS O-acetylase OafA/YrhL
MQPEICRYWVLMASEYFKYGYLGVDLFFIISGFVIAFSIKHLSLRKFCYSRFKRLYPMYWICLLLTFIVSYFWGAPRYHVTFTQLLANLTMVQKLWGQGDVDGAYWSLYVELKFYLIIALFLILNRFKKISLDYLVYFWLLLSSLRFFVGPSEIYDGSMSFFTRLECVFYCGNYILSDFLHGPKSILCYLGVCTFPSMVLWDVFIGWNEPSTVTFHLILLVRPSLCFTCSCYWFPVKNSGDQFVRIC